METAMPTPTKVLPEVAKEDGGRLGAYEVVAFGEHALHHIHGDRAEDGEVKHHIEGHDCHNGDDDGQGNILFLGFLISSLMTLMLVQPV